MKSSDKEPWGIRLNGELDHDDRDLEAAMADSPCGGTSRHGISLAKGQRGSSITAEISTGVRYGMTAGCDVGATGRILYEVCGPRDPLVQALRYIGLGAGDDYSREDILARLSDRGIRNCLPAGLLSILCFHIGVRLDYFSIREKRRGYHGSTRAEAIALVRARASLYTREAIAATAATLPVRPRPPKPGEGAKN